jgi:hypothetical protein
VGFFGFLKKAAGAVFSVAKTVAPLALGGPLGAVAGKFGGSLLGSVLHSKSPMSTGPLKLNILGTNRSIPVLRGKTNPYLGRTDSATSTPRIAAASPVMPGGSFATPQGIMAPGGGLPPATYGGSRTSGPKRKRRSSSSRRSSRARSSARRRGGRKGRKLKFGSAAYRKKYLGHR